MISITIQGDKIIIEGLTKLAANVPHALQDGLVEAAKSVHQNAKYFLHAEGAKARITGTPVKENGKWKIKGRKDIKQNISPGGYPVPIRSGALGRGLKFLYPGQSETWGDFTELSSRKVFKGGSVTAGPLEAIVFNIAPHAHVIHEGLRSSAKFGPRPFLTDALKRFNEGDKLIKIMHENIEKAKKRAGFK